MDAPVEGVSTRPAARCPVCGASAEGRRSTYVQRHVDARSNTEFTLFACGSCALQYWSPLVHPEAGYYEDEALELYTGMHSGARDGAKDPRFQRFLRDFGGERGKRLLDVGCSDGAFMSLFAERGNMVEGIDIDRRSIAVARGRGLDANVRTLEERAADPNAPRALDFLTLFDVLEHVTDPVGLLELAKGLLAPGGRLVVTVPNRERLVANLIRSDFPPHHFLRFDEASVAQCVRRAGLRVEHVDVFQYGYLGPTLLFEANRFGRTVARRPARQSVGAASAGGAQDTRPRLKQRLTGAAEAAARTLMTPLERGLRRGFKLYLVAVRD